MTSLHKMKFIQKLKLWKIHVDYLLLPEPSETALIRKRSLWEIVLTSIIPADGGPAQTSILCEISSPSPFILTIVTYSLQKSVMSCTEIRWDNLLEKSRNTTYDCLLCSVPFPLWREISDGLREISVQSGYLRSSRVSPQNQRELRHRR